ncbi:MAG: transaldolase [Anaerolineae bacterium]|nr:transaldolase [Anaerolineae bacterium]
MALYLDSADPDDARRAAALGFVAGATTNPLLIARSGRTGEQVIAGLVATLPGTIFYQVTAPPGPDLDDEIARLRAISDRVAFKIPCTLDYLAALQALVGRGITCAVTAVYSPAQAYLAAQAGARYAIPYVNRATRLCGDGPALVADLATILYGGECEILAASVKDPAEAAATLLAGAHHLTLPWNVLASLAVHPLTEQALEEFRRAGEGV